MSENDSKQEPENSDGSEENGSEDNQSAEWMEGLNLPDGVDNPEDAVKHFKGIADRRKTKLENIKSGLEDKKDSDETQDDNEPDWGKRAYLNSKDVPDEDHEFVLSIADKTGDSVDEVLNKDWVSKELEERQEHRTTEDAIPESKDRGGKSVKSTVDYWIEKGELPPRDEFPELRSKVVKKKREIAENKDRASKFTDNPIV